MSRPPQAGGDWSSSRDDGWGSATTVRGGRNPAGGNGSSGGARSSSRGSAGRDSSGRDSSARDSSARDSSGRDSSGRDARGDDGWSRGGPAPREQQRANRAAEKRTERSVRELERHREALARPPERGVRAWFALLVVLVIAALGGIIDTIGAIEVQGGFNIGIVVASVVGILIVKRSHMFPLVIAPPIVYTLGAGFQYVIKASGSDATKAKIDAAANYLVYGFPAIAISTAAVLIVAGARLITRK